MNQLFLLSVSILLLLQLTSAQDHPIDDRLAFVFEAVRHGARAPLLKEPPGTYQVAQEMLTAQGMRQRLLLGKMHRERYIDKYHLLDEEYNPNQIYI